MLCFGGSISEVLRPRSARLDDDEQIRIWRVVLDKSAISSRSRERKDGHSYPVRFMGRFPAGIATHLRLRHILALAFGRLTGPRVNDVRQIRSVPGPPAVTIPRITVVTRSSVRSIEILVAIDPPGDGPPHIRSIAVSRLVADDLRGRDQRIRGRLTMTLKRRRIGIGNNQKAGYQHGRKDRSHVSLSPSRKSTSCSENTDTRKYKSDGR
jgi:hypothetical protein